MNIRRKNLEREKLIELLNTAPQHGLLALIKSDLTRYQTLPNALCNLGFWAVLLYRLSHCFFKVKFDILAFPIQLFSNLFLNCDISRKMVAGPNLSIFHPTGVFVGPFVCIGKGAVLGPGCFIGDLNRHEDPTDYPILGDYVNIAAGAKVFGGIAIGERTVIGPNTVVTRNIPASHTVLPPQMHVIKKYEIKKK